MSPDHQLSVKLEHQLGRFHLNIDFSVPLGLIVLFGYSGAGKSVTLQSLAGLLRPRAGSIVFQGEVLFDSQAQIDLAPQVRRVGYVPQRYALFPHLTVEENIRFALPEPPIWSRFTGKHTEQRERITELLTALELRDLTRCYPEHLSGGQQQRVALARALAAQPRLLLLDEPFNALDIPVRERLRDALKLFRQRFNVPTVLVTHDHSEVQQLADTVIVMRHGQVRQIGSVEQVFLTPRTADVAQLVGQRNLFAAQIVTHGEEQVLGVSWLQSASTQERKALAAEQAAWLPLPSGLHRQQLAISGCLLAQEMSLSRLEEARSPRSAAVQWRVRFQEAHMQGASMRVLVQPVWEEAGALEVILSLAQWRDLKPEPACELMLEIGVEAIHVFEHVDV